MAIEEIGHSRVQATTPDTEEFIIRRKGNEADFSMGANGWTGTGVAERGDLFGYGTWTPTLLTPRCYLVSKDPRPPEYPGSVTIIEHYRGPVMQSGGNRGSHIEVIGSGAVQIEPGGLWRGKRKFVCLNNRVTSVIQSHNRERFPGLPPSTAPQAARARSEPDYIPGLARVILEYESEHVGTNRDRRIGHAVMSGGGAGFPVKRLVDGYAKTVEGKVRDGEDSNDPQKGTDWEKHWYRVVEGTNVVEQSMSLRKLETAYSKGSFNVEALIDRRINTINKARLPKIGAPIGAAKMTKETHWWPGAPGKIYVDYYLLIWLLPDGKGAWNNQCKSQKGIYVAQDMPVLDKNGKVLGAPRQIRTFTYQRITGTDDNGVPTLEATDPENRALWPTSDMRDLDRMVD